MNFSSVCKFIGLGALFLAPLALFHVDRSILFPYIVGKAFFWRLAVEVAFVAWAYAALTNKKFQINYKHPLFVALSVFMGIVLIANMLGHDPYASFWSNAERMDGYIGLLHLYLYFIAFIGLIRSRVLMNYYLLYLLTLGLLLSFIGLGQTKDRVDSLLGNPIYLGSLSLFGIFLSGYFVSLKDTFLGLSQKLRIPIFVATGLIFLVTMYMTGTRGALLGLIAGVIATSLFFVCNKQQLKNKIVFYSSLASLVLILVGSSLFFVSRDYLSQQTFVQQSGLLSRAASISLEDRTTSFRLANWQMALQGAAERPVLGWGQEGYIKVFSKYYQVEKLHDTEPWYDRVHNVFLDWLVFSGVLGLGAYLSIFGVSLWLIIKNKSLDILVKGTLVGLVIAYLAQNIVAFDSLVSGIFVYALLSVVYLASSSEKKIIQKDKHHILVWLVIILGLIGSVWWVNYSIVKPFHANQDFIRFISQKRVALTPDERALEQLNVFYIPSLEANTFFTEEILTHMIRLKENIILKELSPETIEQYVATVDTYMVPLLERDPDNAKMLMMYADFLNYVGELDRAEVIIRKALVLVPTKPTARWILASILYKQGKKAEAFEIFKNVYEQIPENQIAKKIYEQALLETQ